MDVELFIPYYIDTKYYCLNKCYEEYEPEDSYSFNQIIIDVDSLKDAIKRLPKKVIKHITHYQRNFNTGGCSFAVEPILEIDSTIGHTIGDSLKEALEEEVNK